MGNDITILELAVLVKKICGYQGLITLDKTKPDGTPRKLMDVDKIKSLGWKASIGLEEGIAKVYAAIKDTDFTD